MTWLDVIERLYPIVAGLLGVGLFEIVRFFWFAKSDKKGKDIENDGKEIDNKGKDLDNENKEIEALQKVIATIQKNYEELYNEFHAYKKEVNERVAFFKEKFDEIEKERDNFKLATMEANRCKLPATIDECPVVQFLRNMHNIDCGDCQNNKHND